jgi:uncharacterized protein
MGRFGHYVIDADGHGGEPLGWRRRIPDEFKPQMRQYVAQMKAKYKGLPGGGMQINEKNPRQESRPEDDLDFDVPMREGMYDPVARIADMDLEGIDVTIMFPPGSGEEWALSDAKFSAAVCRVMNDARAEYASHCPDRLKLVAKLPMIDPELAAEELQRCVEKSKCFVGLVSATHIRDKNLDDPSFDVVWRTAERLGVAVCTHGGGQAPGQTPFVIERFDTRLGIHAITHPVGAMQAVYNFTVGGIWARFPKLRVGFMEANCGWLPFWLERLDEHYELMPEQAPGIDHKPSEYFLEGNCYISCEPDEHMLRQVIELIGDERIVYASDYYHWDCSFPDTVKLIAERNDISDASKKRILSDNATVLYPLVGHA